MKLTTSNRCTSSFYFKMLLWIILMDCCYANESMYVDGISSWCYSFHTELIAIGYPYCCKEKILCTTHNNQPPLPRYVKLGEYYMQFVRCIVMNWLSTNKQTNNLYPIYKPFIQQLHLELILVDTYVVKGSKPSNPKFWVSRCVQFIWRYLFLLPAFLPLNKQ